MKSLRILGAYVLWHYGRGIRELGELWRNLLAFFWHFFSIPLLLRTLLSPWRRMGEATRKPGLHPDQFLGDVIVSTLMRLVGLLVRIPTIVLGLALLLLFTVAFPLAFIIWLLLPPLAVLCVIAGLWLAIIGL